MNTLNKTTVVTSALFADILRKSIIRLNDGTQVTPELQKNLSDVTNVISKLTDITKPTETSYFEFVSGSILYAEALKVATACTTELTEENKDEAIAKLIEEISAAYTPELTSIIDKMAETFAIKIKEGRTNLKALQEVASKLTTEIDDIFAQRCNLDPIVVKVDGAKDAKYDYSICSYEILQSVGNKQDLYKTIEDVTVGSANLNQTQKYAVSNNKFLNKTLNSVVPVTPIINAEQMVLIVDEVVKSDASFNKDKVVNLLTIITSELQVSRLLKEVNIMMNDVINPNEPFFYFINFIKDNGAILTKLEEAILKQGIDVAAIEPNVKVISSIMELGAYFIYQHRETTFADTLLFANGQKNADVLAKAEEAAITNEDIAKHCTTLMKDIPFSKVGLTLSRLVDNKQRVTALFTQAFNADVNYCANTKNKLLKETLTNVLYKHLKGVTNTDCYSEVAEHADRIVRYSLPIQNIVYDLMLSKFHNNTITELMYKELGRAYVDLVAANKEVTDAMINDTSIALYSELISKFMMKFFIAKKEENILSATFS